MQDAAIIVTKQGSLYIAKCQVSGIETYSKDQIRAIEDCRAKSIERFALWQRELSTSLVLSNMPHEEDYANEIPGLDDEDLDLVAKLSEQTKQDVIPFNGLPNLFITRDKKVFEYDKDTQTFIEIVVHSYRKNDYIVRNGQNLFIRKLHKYGFGVETA